ncbi:MAG: hypothetical protein MUO55_02565, partial [Candidatus Atribacteria bacterium]|nr:hypothetical protein [Candidatus Atribacteria bacterium]
MAFLSRKKSDKEYGDDSSFSDTPEGEQRKTRRRFSDRSFKDLQPENRKKRKEPKKPWGKKERLFILLVILLTAG